MKNKATAKSSFHAEHPFKTVKKNFRIKTSQGTAIAKEFNYISNKPV